MGVYQNPIRDAHLTSERVDQGVDYSGSGPIFALGPGIIREISNSGWPGGAFIAEQLTGGPDAGRYVYYAEHITPETHVGQKVDANTKVGQITGGIEIGWAAGPPNLGEAAAQPAGQASATGDPGEHATGFGVSFNNLLKSLGAKGGIVSGKVVGNVPTNGAVNASTGGNGGGLLSDLNPLNAIKDSLPNLAGDLIDGIVGPGGVADFIERAALILIGMLLLLIGIWQFMDPGGHKTKKAAETAAVVVPK